MTEDNEKKQNSQHEDNAESEEKVDISNRDFAGGKKEKTIEQKLADTEEKLLRSLAEIENQRRRFEREIKDAFEFGSFNFAKESLAILDNLQRAKLAIKNDEGLKTNKDLDKFLDNITIFEKNKIKKIETKTKKFDPNFHQAMTEINDETTEPGTILQEIQTGYMFGERLLRPSLVGVAKKNEENEDKKEQK